LAVKFWSGRAFTKAPIIQFLIVEERALISRSSRRATRSSSFSFVFIVLRFGAGCHADHGSRSFDPVELPLMEFLNDEFLEVTSG
jgi:hypothetical protein